MAKNPTTGLDITNNADGAQISGGTVARILKWIGAGITLTGSGTNVYTFPASTDTLAGLGTAQTFTAIQTMSSRHLLKKGADVASANNLDLGTDGNEFGISGTTQINLISAGNWQTGAEIALLFAGALTIKHNQTVSTVFKPILLDGSQDFVTAANTLMGFRYDGTSWHETYRKNAAITNQLLSYVAKSADYTALNTDEFINVDASGAARTITLPTAVGFTNKIFNIRKSDSSGNTVTVNTTSSQTINGALTQVISAQYVVLSVRSDGANWMII